jgi:hypothetical protein
MFHAGFEPFWLGEAHQYWVLKTAKKPLFDSKQRKTTFLARTIHGPLQPFMLGKAHG